MAWDDDKSTAADPDNPSADEQLTADEWDAHVTDQKGHASRHEQGGTDEIAVDTAQITAFAESVEDTVNGLLSGGTNISLTYDDANDTLTIDTSALDEEEVEDAVAALITTDAGLTFNYDDANDTITLGLAAHSSTHENGGADEISVAGLSGDLADAQDPKTHSGTHADTGVDTIDAGDLGGSSGSNGQFLETDGTTASWGTVPTAAIQLIESQSPSATSSADFTTGIDSDHEVYGFFISGLQPATDTVDVHVRVSNDGGSTFESGASAYRWALGHNADNSGAIDAGSSGSDSKIVLTAQDVGNNAGEEFSAALYMHHPADTGLKTQFRYEATYFGGADDLYIANQGAGAYSTTEAIDAVQIFFSSGNISSGTIELFGYN